jgi:hypothetical protein
MATSPTTTDSGSRTDTGTLAGTDAHAGAPTENAVRDLAARWYRALDQHASVESVLGFLADDGLEMVFPETTAHGCSGFRDWYAAVTHRFFNEVHTLREVTITATGPGTAEATVVVNWQASVWNPPAPRSQWLGFDAYQTWTLLTQPDGAARIQRYVVDRLEPMPGSASL